MYEVFGTIWKSVSYFLCSVVKYFRAEQEYAIELDPRHQIHEDDIIKDKRYLNKIIYYYKGKEK